MRRYMRDTGMPVIKSWCKTSANLAFYHVPGFCNQVTEPNDVEP